MATSNDTSGALLPYRPESPIIEFIEFSTDIITSRKGTEQRIATRRYPRHTFNFSTIVIGQNASQQLENQFTSTPIGSLGFGFWHQSVQSSSIVQGSSTLTLVTSYAFYEADGFCLLWESPSKYEILEIDSLTASELTFKTTIANEYTTAYVVPFFYLLLNGAPSWVSGKGSTRFEVEGMTTVLFGIGEYTFGDSYAGYPVIPYTCNLFKQKSLPYRLDALIYETDGVTGVVERQSIWDIAKRQFTFGAYITTPEEAILFYELVYYFRGRQKEMWIPSYEHDFVLAEDIATGDSLIVEDNLFEEIFRAYDDDISLSAYNQICLFYSDGTSYRREITSVTNLGDGTLELGLLEDVPASLIEDTKISFLYFCRLSSDRIEIEWTEGSQEGYSILPFTVVPTWPRKVIGPDDYIQELTMAEQSSGSYSIGADIDGSDYVILQVMGEESSGSYDIGSALNNNYISVQSIKETNSGELT